MLPNFEPGPKVLGGKMSTSLIYIDIYGNLAAPRSKHLVLFPFRNTNRFATIYVMYFTSFGCI